MSSARAAMIFAALSTSCAHVVAPASEPVAASLPEAPASEPVGYYSAQAMREVIAGCRLMVGDERAKTAACSTRSQMLAARVIELTDIGHRLQLFNLLVPSLSFAGGIILGGLIGILVAVLKPSTVAGIVPGHLSPASFASPALAVPR